MTDSLEQRIRRLEDRNEILELTVRYNKAVDDQLPEEHAATYTEDGEFVRGANVDKGREAIANVIRNMSYGIVHMTLNQIIEIDGDRAHQFCYAILGERSRDKEPGSSRWLTTGRYDDTLLRTAEGWRFQRREWTKDANILARPDWLHASERQRLGLS
jgi:hypothetical protein